MKVDIFVYLFITGPSSRTTAQQMSTVQTSELQFYDFLSQTLSVPDFSTHIFKVHEGIPLLKKRKRDVRFPMVEWLAICNLLPLVELGRALSSQIGH